MLRTAVSAGMGFAHDLLGNSEGMPLYTCDRCGFTSTAFRVEAADGHATEYPGCPGTVRIVYYLAARRSELDRYRDEKQGARAITGRFPPGDAWSAPAADRPLAS
jgi:hypothetical protein